MKSNKTNKREDITLSLSLEAVNRLGKLAEKYDIKKSVLIDAVLQNSDEAKLIESTLNQETLKILNIRKNSEHEDFQSLETEIRDLKNEIKLAREIPLTDDKNP